MSISRNHFIDWEANCGRYLCQQFFQWLNNISNRRRLAIVCSCVSTFASAALHYPIAFA